MEDITFAGAFVAGLLSFLTPCVLPLVPVYLGNLVGPEIFDTSVKRSRLPIFLHALCFVFGFGLVFVVLGIAAGLVGFAMGPHQELIRLIAGILLIVFGLIMFASLKVPWLNFERGMAPSAARTTGYVRSFITGGIITVAWTPCVGPVLGGILALAGASQTVWSGAALTAVYSLGLGIPFLIIGVAIDSLLPLVRRINQYSRYIYLVSGVLLIAVGILILTNKLALLQQL